MSEPEMHIKLGDQWIPLEQELQRIRRIVREAVREELLHDRVWSHWCDPRAQVVTFTTKQANCDMCHHRYYRSTVEDDIESSGTESETVQGVATLGRVIAETRTEHGSNFNDSIGHIWATGEDDKGFWFKIKLDDGWTIRNGRFERVDVDPPERVFKREINFGWEDAEGHVHGQESAMGSNHGRDPRRVDTNVGSFISNIDFNEVAVPVAPVEWKKRHDGPRFEMHKPRKRPSGESPESIEGRDDSTGEKEYLVVERDISELVKLLDLRIWQRDRVWYWLDNLHHSRVERSQTRTSTDD